MYAGHIYHVCAINNLCSSFFPCLSSEIKEKLNMRQSIESVRFSTLYMYFSAGYQNISMSVNKLLIIYLIKV